MQFWHRSREAERVILRKCREKRRQKKPPLSFNRSRPGRHEWFGKTFIRNVFTEVVVLLTLKHSRSMQMFSLQNNSTEINKLIMFSFAAFIQFVPPPFPFVVKEFSDLLIDLYILRAFRIQLRDRFSRRRIFTVKKHFQSESKKPTGASIWLFKECKFKWVKYSAWSPSW